MLLYLLGCWCFINSRFRNPVRSPLELTVYFTAIAMGISACKYKMVGRIGLFNLYSSIWININFNNIQKDLKKNFSSALFQKEIHLFIRN